ncbi:2'-5' RNA ligase [Paraburkholderia sp. GAS333]|uniref:2'-5' RNA ligase family protein n=1 Tax=Paraburkholderia sp. GAS333 TaxID=3156279 RepID=UPI003D1DC6A1
MPEQFWLPGLEAPPTPTDGLFFAVFPDTRTAAGIAKLAHQLCGEARVRSKPLAAGRLHATLTHLGNFAGGLPQEKVDAAKRAAESIGMAPFTVEFDAVANFGKRPRPGPMVLTGGEGVVGLHALHDALEQALNSVDFWGHPIASKSYEPHVTLAYGIPPADKRPVEPACWNVREFALIHSLLGRTRHVALARWSLVGGVS